MTDEERFDAVEGSRAEFADEPGKSEWILLAVCLAEIQGFDDDQLFHFRESLERGDDLTDMSQAAVAERASKLVDGRIRPSQAEAKLLSLIQPLQS